MVPIRKIGCPDNEGMIYSNCSVQLLRSARIRAGQTTESGDASVPPNARPPKQLRIVAAILRIERGEIRPLPLSTFLRFALFGVLLICPQKSADKLLNIRMKVVILCGGLGTRMREETEFRP